LHSPVRTGRGEPIAHALRLSDRPRGAQARCDRVASAHAAAYDGCYDCNSTSEQRFLLSLLGPGGDRTGIDPFASGDFSLTGYRYTALFRSRLPGQAVSQRPERTQSRKAPRARRRAAVGERHPGAGCFPAVLRSGGPSGGPNGIVSPNGAEEIRRCGLSPVARLGLEPRTDGL
jgi:hypothetical protein